MSQHNDPEYQEALAERRELREAAKRDGTPEPPHIRRDPKSGEIVKSKRTTTEIRLSAAKRAAEAARLKVQRYSWDTIAEKLGYKSGPIARMAVQRYMERIPVEAIEELRRTELAGLDAAEVALAERIRKGDIKAIEAMLKIKHHRARLAGLYTETPTTAFEAELMVMQTTMHALRISKMHPDMPVEAIIAEITTVSATTDL